MQRFQAILFDMDGVVCDNMPLHRAVWTEFARRHGFDPTPAEIRALDGRRAADIIRSVWDPEMPDERVAALSKERELLYRDRLGTAELHPVVGVGAFLERLVRLGIPRVLATSAVPGNVDVVLERLAFRPFFDAIVTAADVTRGKPDPEVYLTAAGRVGADARRCLVVEDALPGLAAGQAAGCRLLGMATSEDEPALRAAGAEWVAPDFTTLPPTLLDALESVTT